MPVMETEKWLEKFEKACRNQQLKDPYFIQCSLLCGPLEKWFPDKSKEELHHYSLMYGLFKPKEWKRTAAAGKEMKEKKIWRLVEKGYERLKKRWGGDRTFPFLFLAPDLKEEEIKAAFAHEYNHGCRLNHLNIEESKITLKEALIIEGLGEYAVKELYGEKWIAPWIQLYNLEKAKAIWEKQFAPSLLREGKQQYDAFLFGKKRSRLPKWIGYYIGYHTIDSYQARYGPFLISELYTKSADEVIKGSVFSLHN